MAVSSPGSRLWSNIGTYSLLIVVAILVLVPIYWILATSVKPTSEILVTPTHLLTGAATLDHYGEVFAGDFQRFLFNSLIAASGATAIGFILSVPAAWGFAKYRYPGSGSLLSFIVITRVFPPIALALPFFLQFRTLGLVDTPVGLIIGYVPIVLPLMTWMLAGFFRDFPDELVEAARIDGLGVLGTLIRVVLPLSLPALGVAVLFGFLVAWNEFIIALTLTRTPASQTMPVGISTFITQFQILWGQMMAAAAIYLVPVLVVTIVTQRGLVTGLMSGSTKG
jgi:multiple sugar transport system permease protein